ncbi:MAG: hypothetical protein AB9880_10085 [Christensenellales bacterium]
MRWKSKGMLLALLGGLLALLIILLGRSADSGLRLGTIALAFLVTTVFTVAGVFAGERWDKEDLARTRQMNLAAFSRLGIPGEAVHHKSDEPTHFFGIAVDQEKWLLYLLESRNRQESAAAPDRMQIYPFSDIQSVTSSREPRLDIRQRLTGESRTFGFVKDDLVHATTRHYAYDSVRYEVGHRLTLHLTSGETRSFSLNPTRSKAGAHDAQRLIDKLQAAMSAYRKGHPLPQATPKKSPYLR